MREREIHYWDAVAKKIASDGIRDNWLKRQFIGQFLLKCSWFGERVLEIGVGCGVSAGMLSVVCGQQMQYVGTEMSPEFLKVATQNFGLNVVHADILSLPAGKFTRVIALDSLEHVRPEDRFEGYRQIADRLEDGGLLLVNMPCHRSSHVDEFDHGFDLRDLAALEDAGLRLETYNRYRIKYGIGERDYAFLVMSK